MTPAKYVPWPYQSNVHPTLEQCSFTLGAYPNVAFHHWRRLRHAEIDEMLDMSLRCCSHSTKSRRAINRPKLCGLSGARMGYSDQLNERVTGRDAVQIGRSIERIRDDGFATLRQFLLATCANQSTYVVSSRDQLSNQRPPDVAAPASHKNAMPIHIGSTRRCVHRIYLPA